jgi:hypothetical protein
MIELDEHGDQIKNSNFKLVNEEDSDERPRIKFNCYRCKSEILIQNIRIKNKKSIDDSIFLVNDDCLDTVRDIVKNNRYFYCPLCGFKNNLLDVEVSSYKHNTIYKKKEDIEDFI